MNSLAASVNFLQQVVWVGAGGCVGAVLRHLCILLGEHLQSAARFPWAVTSVNLTGCFLIGVVNGIAESKGLLTPQLRLLIVVGFLGSFTTYSTFGHDAFLMVREGAWLKVLLYTAGKVVLGILFVWLGYILSAK